MMKNLKRVAAIILSCHIIMLSLLSTFAESSKPYYIEEEWAKKLGIIIGGNPEKDYLNEEVHRFQVAIIYLRTLGYEDEAKKFTGKDNFEDANDLSVDFSPYMAYLKANPLLGWIGTSKNHFEPLGTVNAQVIYKVILESLGYKCSTSELKGDFEYKDTLAFAAEKGLSKVAEIDKLTVNDMLKAILEALTVKVKNTDSTLLDKLVDRKVIDQKVAKEYVDSLGH